MTQTIDIFSLFRNRINSMLTTASWIEPVKQMLGITGVSPVWDDVPAWYFWIQGAPGVYALVLEQIGSDGSENSSSFHGLFSLKCYPFPDSKEFPGFSFLEQRLVSSEYFDRTNTPKFECRETIPAPLFVVGAIELELDREDGWSVLTLECQDVIRARYEAEALEDYPLIDVSRIYSPGDVGREIAAWRTSWPLFDRVVSLWAHYTKVKPAQILLGTAAGFEYVYRGPAGWQCVETPGTTVRSLRVLFVGAKGKDEIKRPPGREHSGLETTVIYDGDSTCACPSHAGHACKDTPYANPLWWSLPDAEFTSELGSTCGCT
ncbi:MAG: hypothetical protein HY914_22115 [Desulfomonile tiedjei]|nr:hypothetical protein [Desulfomonile tiedjei]